MQALLDKAAKIRLIIFDVDGVLTDGRLYFGNDGDELKAFNCRDGHGIKMLQNNGIDVAVISGRRSKAVETRMMDLKVRHVHLGAENKLRVFEDLCEGLGVDTTQVAYLGDDVIDLPVMRRVGLAIAVQDADAFVKEHAHWTTPTPGGRGAARDACELILSAHGKLESERAKYL